MVSAIIPGLIILGDVISLLSESDFSRRPDYDLTLVSEFWQQRPSLDEREFLITVDNLYGQEMED